MTDDTSPPPDDVRPAVRSTPAFACPTPERRPRALHRLARRTTTTPARLRRRSPWVLGTVALLASLVVVGSGELPAPDLAGTAAPEPVVPVPPSPSPSATDAPTPATDETTAPATAPPSRPSAPQAAPPPAAQASTPQPLTPQQTAPLPAQQATQQPTRPPTRPPSSTTAPAPTAPAPDPDPPTGAGSSGELADPADGVDPRAIPDPVDGGAPPAPAPARSVGLDRPWVGYPLDPGPASSAGWLGARRAGSLTVVYRVDPARPAAAGYRRGPVTSDFRAGSGPVGEARTACAALLLGRFGVPANWSARGRQLQAAAVDVAVLHLLVGGTFRHDGPAQRRRVDRRRNGPFVRAYAERLVAEQCRFAGPYDVTLTQSASRARVGDRVGFAAQVRSRTGAPVPGVELRVDSAVSGPVTLRTGSDGRAAFALTAARPGPLVTDVETFGLPSARLQVLVPRRAGAARAVQAGVRLGAAHLRRASVAVLAEPRVRVAPVRGARAGRPFRGQVVLAGSYPGRRTALVQVFGPYGPDRADLPCVSGRLARQVRVPVTADRTYRTARITLRQRGAYVWRVSVPGDTYNLRTSRCGGRFGVR